MAGNPLDQEGVARIRAAVDAYNRSLSGASTTTTIRLAAVFVPLVIVVALVAWILNGGALQNEIWTSPLHVFLYAAGAIGGIAGYLWATAPKRRNTGTSADHLFPVLFSFIDNFDHQRDVTPASFGRMPRELTGEFSGQRFDDVVTGNYRGFDFELFEVVLTSRTQDSAAFSGAGLAFEAERPFPGVLIAGLQAPKARGFFGRVFGGRSLKQVMSGVEALDAAYIFKTDNPDAAAPLLSDSLAKTLHWLGEMWPDGRAVVALKGSDAFVLLPSDRNLLELPAAPQPVDFERDVRPAVTDVFVMLETAALLRKLN